MDFVPLLAAVALVWKAVDFAKYVRVGDTDSWATQAVVWLAGVGVAFLLAASDFASGVELGGLALADMNAFSVALIGLSIGSGGAVAYDFKRALDRSDSAATPSLVSGARPPLNVPD